ncbi:hypothetical protein H6F47_04180 [Sphaerospermopsis sp. FACHB-1094]|uniref:hypothetical protein n=1 Tax=Sphaerospermopsis sp. FACHB-1094 TaxID=2692861 RepID=UPI001683DAEF|nr:hypothetical protein [Sphaerospermopsis sp. FACHB-1094]MBD2131672.1 hypothetical protein [Sphaerospermopsis sp. FACHB-1094]
MDISEKIMFLIGGLFFVLIGICLLILSLEDLKLFVNSKQKRIGSINPGEKVFISGYIDDHPKLYSPVTQKKCAAWEVCVYSDNGKNKNILLYSSSNENITITDEIDSISVNIVLNTPFNIIENIPVKSVLQISQKHTFRDHQNTFSKFRDQRSYDFLEEYNFKKVNLIGLGRQLTIEEKKLLAGDKIFALGEVIIDGNQKVLKAKLASDSLFSQISMIIFLLGMGLILLIVGLGMCQQVFLY